MRSLHPLGVLVASSALFGAVGCTATVVDPAPDGGPATTTQALILMERSERDGKPAHTNFSAKFLRVPVTADSEAIERVVGSELDLPSVGECMTVAADAAATADLAAVGPIELFDVGDLTIRTQQEESIPLAARAFPDVADLVSGAFYTSPDAARDLPAPGKYILQSSGSPAVDRFAIETDAPPAPSDVRISGQPLADGIDLAEGATIEVRWRADGAMDDVAYLEIVSENGVAARCAFDDRGRGSLPASLLRSAGFGSLPMGATLALHRVRQGSFQVPGVDSGEVRFDVSVVASVTLLSEDGRRPAEALGQTDPTP